MSRVFIAAAKRTAVIPKGGAFAHLQADELAAPVIQDVLNEAGYNPADVDQVILGNALYAGGNPARMAALRAGLPDHIPAMTLDTQCCGGMDALHYGAALIRSGAAKAVLVGGLESYSRAPIRLKRPVKNEEAIPYNRPPFSPWADRDPDMLVSAAELSREYECLRAEQESFAKHSHQKALLAREGMKAEITPIADQVEDAFTRKMSQAFLERLPAIAGDAPFDLTAATIAVEADAAAILLLLHEDLIKAGMRGGAEVIRSLSIGCDPAKPALSPLFAMERVLELNGQTMADMTVIEMMEAFALQGVLLKRALGDVNADRVNPGGGALSRGHPIGASGAINLVRLYHQLQKLEENRFGIAAIAAAGGLGSAAILRNCI